MTPASDRRQTAATITGIDAEKIATFNLQLTRLRQLGILIVVEVKGLSMFTTSATFAQYGIADEDVRRETLDAGRLYLFPREIVKRLRTLETRFRQVADEYTFDVEGVKPYKWLPFTAYDKFREKWDRLLGEWADLRKEIVANYDGYVDQHSKAAAGAADRAWVAIKSQDYDAIEINGRTFRSKASFIDATVEQAQAKIPSKNRIKTELIADYRVALLDEGDGTGTVDFSTLEGEGKVAMKLAAIKQAELEHARAALAEMSNPLDEVFADLRRRVRDDVAGMLDSIETNGFLKGKVAEKGAGLLELFDLLAVHGDTELRNKLAELKGAIGAIGSERRQAKGDEVAERDIEAITATLKQIVKLADAEVEDVAIDARFAFLETGSKPATIAITGADDDD